MTASFSASVTRPGVVERRGHPVVLEQPEAFAACVLPARKPAWVPDQSRGQNHFISVGQLKGKQQEDRGLYGLWRREGLIVTMPGRAIDRA
ncbi:MAG TPA: hypothetical protein VEY31_02440 [Roseococcus sp.]|jgi:hypothetical protein|nr:hypothetical protein [Roseococcus sp.]